MTIYMQIPGIQGSVTAQGFSGWIECDSLKHGVGKSISSQAGRMSDRTSSSPGFSNIYLTRKMDKASPHLFQKACENVTIPQVTIDACYTDHSTISSYLKYTLSNVIIASRDIILHKSSGKPIEVLELNYSKIEEKYTPRDEQNNMQAPISSGYNLETAQVM